MKSTSSTPTFRVARNFVSHQLFNVSTNKQHYNITTMAIIASVRRPVCLRNQLTSITPLQQTRNATFIKRPKLPYTFTQLIKLSDGSTFLHRTTSPQAVYQSMKDTKNTLLWNPSDQKLANVEEDEAGLLKRFRGRFGRGWDAEVVRETTDDEVVQEEEEPVDSLLDLMNASAQEADRLKPAKKEKKKK
ncbi:hypothetical protein MRB53_038531 [Persea americana]|nr:hypothetical protein MRB53_038531 [Persea americana]